MEMSNINELINAITSILIDEKAYDLPNVCSKYGLDYGDELEAYNSKRVYVQRRLKGKEQIFLLDLAKRVIDDYGSNANELLKIINRLNPNGFFNISELTRRNIIEWLYSKGNIEGKLDLTDFLSRIWNLKNMPSTDPRYSDALGDIWHHMINNSDWDEKYLYEDYLELITATDEILIRFLELVVHPLVRHQSEVKEYIKTMNSHLRKDGFQFVPTDNLSGYTVFTINQSIDRVKGKAKNLIFAAIGEKPDIIISDSINNDIKIVNHQSNCLVYDYPISNSGLYWLEMVKWWADTNGMDKISREIEINLYKRLISSLDSEPERTLYKSYFHFFRNHLKEKLPALIPQVYLHYDPYTMKQRKNSKVLPRQRMDFLLLLPNQQRIVIEIDGKQHYSNGDISNPKLYSEMVSADRELKLRGYEVYRFGGYEFLAEEKVKETIKEFFERLFSEYCINSN